MKTRAVIFLLSANLLLWVFFWVDFSGRLVSYKQRPPTFDENVPLFVFWGKALPVEQMRSVCLRMMEWVQVPSFLVVRPVVYALNQKPSVWEKTFGGLSPWSYLLIAVMLLSFLQWYFIGWLIGKLWQRWSHPTAAVSRA